MLMRLLYFQTSQNFQFLGTHTTPCSNEDEIWHESVQAESVTLLCLPNSTFSSAKDHPCGAKKFNHKVN